MIKMKKVKNGIITLCAASAISTSAIATKPTKPEDILSDTQSVILINGVHGRKGSIGAFLKKCRAIRR